MGGVLLTKQTHNPAARFAHLEAEYRSLNNRFFKCELLVR
jgi:hypothetical protein